MPNHRRLDPEAKRAALAMLRQGEATLSEIAELAGVSRQIVRYWADAAGVPWAAARKDRLAKKWRKAISHRH